MNILKMARQDFAFIPDMTKYILVHFIVEKRNRESTSRRLFCHKGSKTLNLTNDIILNINVLRIFASWCLYGIS